MYVCVCGGGGEGSRKGWRRAFITIWLNNQQITRQPHSFRAALQARQATYNMHATADERSSKLHGMVVAV